MDMTGEECLECNAPCIEKMFGCSGLPQVVDETVTDPTLPELIDNTGEESTDSPTSSPKPSPLGSSGNASNETPSPVSTDNTFTFKPTPLQPTDRGNSASGNQLRLVTVVSMVVLGMLIV